MSRVMDCIWKRFVDVITQFCSYLQKVRISDIRQTFELLGINHLEVAIALALFLMLQFTKFTAVLLLACIIAYSIFYMWDTVFLDAEDCGSNNPENCAGYGTGYGPGYTYGALTPQGPSHRDVRTSAHLPPYSNNFNPLTGGEHEPERRMQVNTYINQSTPTSGQQFTSTHLSGYATPVGPAGSFMDARSNRRQPEEYRYVRRSSERDPQSVRRMTTNDYRFYRTQATDPSAYYRYLAPNEDQRGRSPDESRKNRRPPDSRITKKYHGGERVDRLRNESPENMQRRSRNIQGTSNRASGSHNRPDHDNRNHIDSRDRRADRVDQNILNRLRLNRWNQTLN